MSGRRLDPRSVRVSVALYRLGLHLYPARFRRAFGAEITAAFYDLARHARRRRGLRGVLALWPATLVDLLRGGLAERWSLLRDRHRLAALATADGAARSRRALAVLRLRSQTPPQRSVVMEKLVQDLRFAARQLRRSPGFTAAIVATIALGVGANTAIFTVIEGVVLRPLPFPHSERAVVFCELNPRVGDYCIASPPNVADWGRMSESLADVGVARTWTYHLLDDEGQTSISSAIATPGYLRVHGAQAEIGRLLQEDDMPEGSNRVVVLTHDLWQSRFAGDPNIVGRSLSMDGEPYTVIGVLADGTWTHDFDWVQAWVPLTATPEETNDRSWRGFSAVGLLAEGATLSQARQELEGIRASLAEEYPEDNQAWGLRVEGMRDEVAGPVRPILLLFTAAVGCVLLIGCANVANLLLVRATQRSPEFALRASLGAGRSRLVRQVLTESVLLGGVGGLLGLALALGATDGFLAMAPDNIPRLAEVGVDLRVLGFTALLSVATAVLFGVIPALRAARTDLNDSLRNLRHAGGGSRRMRDVLVVGQMAMALVLLIGAGLLGRSFAALLNWDPGFDRDGLVTVWTFANMGMFETGEEIVNAFEQVGEEIRAIPGVLAVGETSAGPLFGGRETSAMTIEGRPPLPPEEQPSVRWYDMDPAYFATMGIPVVRGRSFQESDNASSPLVAMVNETFARRHFPDGNALGERVTVDERTMEIVGVVADVKPFQPDESPAAEIYYPRRQYPRGGTYYVIRSGIPAASLQQQIQDRIQPAHPEVDLSAVRTLQDRADGELVSPRFNLLLMALFAAIALALAAVGVYGVMAYSVATRTHEIGVRVALGARPAAITLSIVRSALTLAAIGLAIGIGVALAAGRLLASQLHGVSSRDLPTYLVVTGVVLIVSVVASSIPARRAARLDPSRALREE